MEKKVILVHNASFPVARYGGTERVIWWLAKGLSEKGVSVRIACRPGSSCPYAETIPVDFARPVEPQLPKDGIVHYHYTPPEAARERAHLVTVHGNGKEGEEFLPNSVFVSRDHARRHGAGCFVHNGIDPGDYLYASEKDSYLLFLAKAAWSVKNVRGAIRLALAADRPLRIVGGTRRFVARRVWGWRGIHWEGILGGERKAQLVSRARGLLFPVVWNEPFGIAVVEALISGTPVLASPYGSLPELVAPHVGRICGSEEEFLDAIPRLEEFRPAACREWAMESFHYERMTDRYLELYAKVRGGEALNPVTPKAARTQGSTFPIPRRGG